MTFYHRKMSWLHRQLRGFYIDLFEFSSSYSKRVPSSADECIHLQATKNCIAERIPLMTLHKAIKQSLSLVEIPDSYRDIDAPVAAPHSGLGSGVHSMISCRGQAQVPSSMICSGGNE